MPNRELSKHIQIAAIGNAIIALAKLSAALWTGSIAMMATTVHALADASSLGMVIRDQAGKPERSPNARMYFSSYVVAILVYAMGAGVTISHGIERLRVPLPQYEVSAGMLVVAAALLFQILWRWRISTLAPTPSGPGALGQRPSRNPVAHTALLTNTSALLGSGLTLASLVATTWLAGPATEALASIAIGLIQGFTAARLAISIKGVLVQLPALPSEDPPLRPANEPIASEVVPTPSPIEPVVNAPTVAVAEPPKRNHPPAQPSRKAKKRRR